MKDKKLRFSKCDVVICPTAKKPTPIKIKRYGVDDEQDYVVSEPEGWYGTSGFYEDQTDIIMYSKYMSQHPEYIPVRIDQIKSGLKELLEERRNLKEKYNYTRQSILLNKETIRTAGVEGMEYLGDTEGADRYVRSAEYELSGNKYAIKEYQARLKNVRKKIRELNTELNYLMNLR